MNTPEKGTFRYIVFKDGNTHYAVALEFNIVESAEDPKLAFFNLMQAVDGYVGSSKKIKGFRYFSFLNQNSDPEYENLWNILNYRGKGKIKTKSPYVVNMYGYSAVPV